MFHVEHSFDQHEGQCVDLQGGASKMFHVEHLPLAKLQSNGSLDLSGRLWCNAFQVKSLQHISPSPRSPARLQDFLPSDWSAKAVISTPFLVSILDIFPFLGNVIAIITNAFPLIAINLTVHTY
jgi:hypothetical protein